MQAFRSTSRFVHAGAMVALLRFLAAGVCAAAAATAADASGAETGDGVASLRQQHQQHLAVAVTLLLAMTLLLLLRPWLARRVRAADVAVGPHVNPVLRRLQFPVHGSHRGGSKTWPENTLLAFQNCVACRSHDDMTTNMHVQQGAKSDALKAHGDMKQMSDGTAGEQCWSQQVQQLLLEQQQQQQQQKPGVGAQWNAEGEEVWGGGGPWCTQVVELDVQLSKDGHLVVMHNLTVDSTTDGSGCVSDFTLEQLKGLDAAYHFSRDGGHTFPYRGTGVTVPTLVEALDVLVPLKHVVIYLDFKRPDAVAPTLELVRKYGIQERIIMGAVPPAANKEVLRLKPHGVPATPDIHSMIFMYACYVVGLLWLVPMRHEIVGTTAYRWGWKVLTPELITAFRKRNRLMAVFGDYVDSAQGQEDCIQMGCDILVTDRPDVLCRTMQRMQLQRHPPLLPMPQLGRSERGGLAADLSQRACLE